MPPLLEFVFIKCCYIYDSSRSPFTSTQQPHKKRIYMNSYSFHWLEYIEEYCL